MDEHGKNIVNFQLSILVYSIVCIPLILLLGLGLVGLIVLAIVSFIFPVINAIKASNGETPKYPLSLNFISYKSKHFMLCLVLVSAITKIKWWYKRGLI